MPAGAGNPPNIKMEPPKSNFNIREGGGGGRFNIRGKRLHTYIHTYIYTYIHTKKP